MSVQRFQSLPKKTQPTLHSSFKQSHTVVQKYYNKGDPHCPETSEFRLHKQQPQSKSREKIYIHNLHIDYGRLQKPNHYYFDGNKYAKAIKMKEVNFEQQLFPEHMQTKRVTGVSSFLDESELQQKNTQKKRVTDQKMQVDFHKTQQTRIQTIQNLFPTSNSISKPKIRLQEVKAYEQVHKNESNRKRLHSRIVKMVVGGGNKKTKIICYPDTSDYQRLCNQK